MILVKKDYENLIEVLNFAENRNIFEHFDIYELMEKIKLIKNACCVKCDPDTMCSCHKDPYEHLTREEDEAYPTEEKIVNYGKENNISYEDADSILWKDYLDLQSDNLLVRMGR